MEILLRSRYNKCTDKKFSWKNKPTYLLIQSVLPRTLKDRDAARFSNPGGQVVMRWAKSVPLIIIGLIELPNSEWAKAHPAHMLVASLHKYSEKLESEFRCNLWRRIRHCAKAVLDPEKFGLREVWSLRNLVPA